MARQMPAINPAHACPQVSHHTDKTHNTFFQVKCGDHCKQKSYLFSLDLLLLCGRWKEAIPLGTGVEHRLGSNLSNFYQANGIEVAILVNMIITSHALKTPWCGVTPSGAKVA